MLESSDDAQSTWGMLGLAGELGLCRAGTATLAGGAAIAEGSTVGVTVVSGGVGLGGILSTGLATALPLFVIGLILRWRTNQ